MCNLGMLILGEAISCMLEKDIVLPLLPSQMSDVPKGDPGKGASVFRQRCAECHTAEMVSVWIIGYRVSPF